MIFFDEHEQTKIEIREVHGQGIKERETNEIILRIQKV